VFLKHTQRPIAGAINTINLMPRFGTRRSVAQIKPEAGVPSETSFRESTLNLFEFPDDRAIDDVIEPEEEEEGKPSGSGGTRASELFKFAVREAVESEKEKKGINVSRKQVGKFLESVNAEYSFDDLIAMRDSSQPTVRDVMKGLNILEDYEFFVMKERT
jgi:hypothetical protein